MRRHMRLDIRGAILDMARSNAKLADRWGLTEDGQTMTRLDAVDTLTGMLLEGQAYLPMGGPCEGWDAVTGCPGHPSEVKAG